MTRTLDGTRDIARHATEPGMPVSEEAVIVTDGGYRVTALNPAAEALTGWHAAHATGTPLAAVLGTGLTYIAPPQGRCMVQSRDGRVHATHAASTAIRDAAGRRVGTVTVLTSGPLDLRAPETDPQLDLAAPEVELAIDALGAGIRERAEEVTALMNVIPVAIYLAHDADCNAVTTNRAAEALLAARPADTGEPHPYHHRVYQNGRELGPHEMPIQRAAGAGVPTDGAEYEIRFDDGTSRYIYGYARPLFGTDGRTRGSVAAFVDVTERRHNENALLESEQRFRVLADNVPAMIWVADRDGALTYFNKTWRDFTGRGADEARNSWLDCVHPDDGERVRNEFNAHFEQRRPFTLELRLRRFDGTYSWILNTATPLYCEEGGFSGYIGTCTDITASKLHEQRLEQADRQKDEFIATLAHELRNPLAPIRNALHILGSGTIDNNGVRWAREVIERQVTQLVRLVDDLLDVARAACGHLELRQETITVDQVVHDAVEASRPLLEDGHHELHISLPADPILVHGDPTRLAEILINLLNNAAKYTPRGGHVWVVCERTDEHVMLRVRDNGVGIAPDALPGIFTMFSQIDTSLDRAQGGLGVGLALARKLAELHGGELHAHSAGLGLGSEFVLTLPVTQPQPRIAASPVQRNTGAADSLRVLVVDDSEDAAESLAMLLRLSAHTVDIAHDGIAALERFADFAPDAVILDIGLPGMSGYEIAERMRQLPRGQEVTLIALTGWGRNEERARAFAAGFDQHLTKPVSVERLQQLLAAQPQH
jgi:PAS domain S-box-containing protein